MSRLSSTQEILGCIQRPQSTLLRFGVIAHLLRARRESYLGKFRDEDTDSCRPSTVGTFKEISVESRVIKDLMAGLPTGMGEPSTPVTPILLSQL